VRALRRLFGFLTLVGLALAGIVFYRRRFAPRRERADLYYEDGSLVSPEQGEPEAERLLPLAREVIDSARAPA
jgi:hypothetical protein